MTTFFNEFGRSYPDLRTSNLIWIIPLDEIIGGPRNSFWHFNYNNCTETFYTAILHMSSSSSSSSSSFASSFAINISILKSLQMTGSQLGFWEASRPSALLAGTDWAITYLCLISFKKSCQIPFHSLVYHKTPPAWKGWTLCFPSYSPLTNLGEFWGCLVGQSVPPNSHETIVVTRSHWDTLKGKALLIRDCISLTHWDRSKGKASLIRDCISLTHWDTS